MLVFALVWLTLAAICLLWRIAIAPRLARKKAGEWIAAIWLFPITALMVALDPVLALVLVLARLQEDSIIMRNWYARYTYLLPESWLTSDPNFYCEF